MSAIVRRSTPALLAAAAALWGCGSQTAVIPVPVAETGIGRACGDGAPPALLAARAIVSFWGFRSVVDVQLVDAGLPGVSVAFYRVGSGESPGQQVQAVAVRLSGSCVELVSRGEPCDPLAVSALELPAFPEGSVAVGAASLEPWDAVEQPVVFVPVAGVLAGDDSAGIVSAEASSTCVYEMVDAPDGTPVPLPLVSWVERARVSRSDGASGDIRTDFSAEVTVAPGVTPRSLSIRSDAVDVECFDVGAGPRCTARLTRTTERLDMQDRREGGRRYETTGVDVVGWDLDADCLDAGGDADSCRQETGAASVP